MSDLFSRIKREVPPDNHDLTTAEGRADWDAELRLFVSKVDHRSVRGHLGNMVKRWRWQVYREIDGGTTLEELQAEVAERNRRTGGQER